MRAVVRGILVCLMAAALCCGDTLDEAARSLARKVPARLAPGEVPHISGRNLSTLGSREYTKARSAFERSLHRNTRTIHPVEVVFTISQNFREYLLVAEVLHPLDRTIEMIPYHPDVVTHSTKALLDRRLLWEQENPILDVAVIADRMLVLEPATLKLFARHETNWEPLDERPLNPAGVVRDPRGRLQISEASLTAYLPGVTCRGSWTPTLDVRCETGEAAFLLSSEPVKLIAGRNALAAAGWPLFFSYGRIAEQPNPLYLLAETDGRTHVYDAERRPAAVFEVWGSDFVVAETGCGNSRDILATAASDRDTNDTIADFEIEDRKPVQASDAVEFPGPVTALWPAPEGAIAVAHNLNTGRYAAYSIAIHCSH